MSSFRTSRQFIFTQFAQTILTTIFLLFLTAESTAQISVSGRTQTPEAAAQKPLPTLAERIARGEAPFSLRDTTMKDRARIYQLPNLTERELRQSDQKGRLRIGAVRGFDKPVEMTSVSSSFKVAEGTILLARFKAEGALKLRLQLANLQLPAGARLFVYSAKKTDEFYGPLSAETADENGAFWTPPVEGDTAVIEYFIPAAAAAGLKQPFQVVAVSHIFRDAHAQMKESFVAQTGPAACNKEVPTDWNDAARSVGMLQFTNPKGEFLCSAVLLNNIAETGESHVLTANHCLSTQAEAHTVRAYWLYDTGDEPAPVFSFSGGTLLVSSPVNDFTFLKIAARVPAGVRFSGWTTEAVAPGTPVTSIHHPQGSHWRYSSGNAVVGNCPAGFPASLCDNYIQVRWNSGITEPGSSGGPLWVGPASDPKLVGVLTGGDSSCAKPTGVDIYGRFDLAFPAIARYLTGAGCLYELSSHQELVGASGETRTLAFKLREGAACAWTAKSNSPWISITAGNPGAGDGNVTFTVAANTDLLPRYGWIEAAGHPILIQQVGTAAGCRTEQIQRGFYYERSLTSADCRSALSPDTFADRYTFNAEAGQQVAISVLNTDVDTLVILYGPDGSVVAVDDDGMRAFGWSRIPIGSYTYFPLPATGVYTIEVTTYYPDETGEYRIQLEAGCVVTATPKEVKFPQAGGSTTVTINSPPECGWKLRLDSGGQSWLTATPASSGTGTQTLTLTAEPNPTVAVNYATGPRTLLYYIEKLDPTRPGHFEGGLLNISQMPICAYSTQPGQSTVPAIGTFGSELLQVYTGLGCPWNASSDSPWLKIVETNKSTGQLRFTADTVNLANSPRTGKITIEGVTHTVTQNSFSNCQPLPIKVGETIQAQLVSNCISLTGLVKARQYTFNGTAGQRIAMHISSPQTDMVIYLLGPDGKRLLTSGNSFYVPLGFNASRIPTGGGFFVLPENGVYTIDISTALESNPVAYSLTLTESLEGECQNSISSLTRNFGINGGAANFALAMNGQCGWTAKSAAQWITITSNTTGQGNGTISYKVAPNSGEPRTGYILIGGWQYQVKQAGSGLAVVNAADYCVSVTAQGIAALFGANLATGVAVAASLPLPTNLNGTTVTITDTNGKTTEAPLFFVSPGQINFLVPYVYAGQLTVTVTNPANQSFSGKIFVESYTASLFTADSSGRGVAAAVAYRWTANSSDPPEILPVAILDSMGRLTANPIDLGGENQGVTLALFGTGLRFPEYPHRVKALINGEEIRIDYVGSQPSFAGLDQVNITLPKSLRGKGDVEITLVYGDFVSNPVTVRIK